jgi:hypothetical protein
MMNRLSEAHKQRGTLMPGMIPLDGRGTRNAADAAGGSGSATEGRSLTAVYARGRRLQVPDGRRRRG